MECKNIKIGGDLAMKLLHEPCSPHQQCISCHMYNYALFHLNFYMQLILWQEQGKWHPHPVGCHRSPECEHTGLHRQLHTKVQEAAAPEGTHFMVWAIYPAPVGTRGLPLYAKIKASGTFVVLKAIVLHSYECVCIITSTGEGAIGLQNAGTSDPEGTHILPNLLPGSI